MLCAKLESDSLRGVSPMVLTFSLTWWKYSAEKCDRSACSEFEERILPLADKIS